MNLAKSLRDLFSGVSDAANQYQVVKPGRAARDLARRIRNEDASYDNFTRNLASLSRALPEEIENRDLLRGVRLKFGHDHADRLEEDLLQTEDALRNLKAVLEHASTSTVGKHIALRPRSIMGPDLTGNINRTHVTRLRRRHPRMRSTATISCGDISRNFPKQTSAYSSISPTNRSPFLSLASTARLSIMMSSFANTKKNLV